MWPEVRHLIATGGSQSGARLGTYINGIHVTRPLFDAFLLVVYPNTPCALMQASAPAELPQTFGPTSFTSSNGSPTFYEMTSTCRSSW